MLSRRSYGPFLTVLLVTGLLSIMLPGGCPQAQQPTTQTTDQTTNTNTNTNTNTGQSGETPRPIPTPSGDTGDSGSSGSNTGSNNSGSSGTSTGAGKIYVAVTKPFNSTTIIPPGTVDMLFTIATDFGTSVASGEFLLARDENSDHAPDGDPVYTQPITANLGANTFTFNTQIAVDQGLLTNGFGRFVLGVHVKSTSNTEATAYAVATIGIDTVAPTATFVSAGSPPSIALDQGDHLVTKSTTWTVVISTADNSPHTLLVQLEDASTGTLTDFAQQTYTGSTGTPVNHTISLSLGTMPSGTFYYRYSVAPQGTTPTSYSYATNPGSGDRVRLGITNRLVGMFDLSQLTDSTRGAILQGFNFNDLAGSSIAAVPDLNGDRNSELVIASRFGKPFNWLAPNNSVGFGEAYLFYGNQTRLHGTMFLNSAGASVPGLIFRGIRTPVNVNTVPPAYSSTGWTSGISDVTVIPDMDGDGLPELVFSFPRVESITLGATDPKLQLLNQVPDLADMGSLEYNSYYGTTGPATWHAGEAQFTRGGVVIVSSHNTLLTDQTELNRKSDRVMDLHEVGQLFDSMSRAGLVPFITTAISSPNGGADIGAPDTGDCLDCDANASTGGCVGGQANQEATVSAWAVVWDLVFSNQPPGGFLQAHTFIPATPPLANPSSWPYTTFPFPYYPDITPAAGKCPLVNSNIACHIKNYWTAWGFCMAGIPFPGGDSSTCGDAAWNDGGTVIWTGFYGPKSTPAVAYSTGAQFPAPVGARILGQKVEDRFGTQVSADGTWLYISAPERTANDSPYSNDVSGIGGTRSKSGIVYQLRTDSRQQIAGPTRTQLWIEPGQQWPRPDHEIDRLDYTMPVPHNYIIACVGSVRAAYDPDSAAASVAFAGTCPPAYDPSSSVGNGSAYASAIASVIQPPWPSQSTAFLYPPGTAGDYVDRVSQIVGPHANAKISYVRALGDVNGDGVRDFAVGSDQVKSNIVGGTGDTVGALFIVYGRPTGVVGDFLLENIARAPGAANRLNGVLLKGSSAGETLGRVVANAGDFNGDGFADVLIGNQGALTNTGEAVLLFGASDLLSPGDDTAHPGGGWTVNQLFDPDDPAYRPDGAIRFVGAAAGDLAGANVASAGDIDGDGLPDILIAAPGAQSGRGAVYLIYGSATLTGVVNLANVGTIDLPGVIFTGRNIGDFLGGGVKTVANTTPTSGSTVAESQGLSALGDIDGDGLADFAISSMLASPGGRTNAGEVYVLYGKTGD